MLIAVEVNIPERVKACLEDEVGGPGLLGSGN